MEWKETRLGDISTLIAGYAFKAKDFGPYPDKVIKIGDINPPIVNYESENGIDLSKYDKNKLVKFIVNYDDFVLAMTGATIGKVGRYVAKEPSYLNQRVLLFKPHDTVNKKFIYYLVSSQVFGKYVLNHIDSESAQPNISANTISKYQFDLPNIHVQTKIAKILSSLDAKIENNNKINANLEAQAAALFKSWFVDFEPFKDGEFVESELGMIPKGWKVGTLDSLCSFISRGMAPKYNDDTNEWILGQTCVRNNIVTLNNARKHLPKTKTEKWVKQWDILLNSTGIGSLGRVGIVYFDKDNVAFDTHITVVRVADSLYRHYVGRNLLSRQLEIENMAVGSTGQTELPKESVKTMPIIIPEGSILEQFNKLNEPIGKMMISNIDENQRLSSLRDTLLPKLMSGEIDLDNIKL